MAVLEVEQLELRAGVRVDERADGRVLREDGGGEVRAPVGRPGPCTPWGKPALGLKTRQKKKQSDKLIIRRRDGRAIK